MSSHTSANSANVTVIPQCWDIHPNDPAVGEPCPQDVFPSSDACGLSRANDDKTSSEILFRHLGLFHDPRIKIITQRDAISPHEQPRAAFESGVPEILLLDGARLTEIVVAHFEAGEDLDNPRTHSLMRTCVATSIVYEKCGEYFPHTGETVTHSLKCKLQSADRADEDRLECPAIVTSPSAKVDSNSPCPLCLLLELD